MLRVIGCITQQHDLRLVALAGLLCFFACATAMSMIGRARVAEGRVRLIWLGAAGLVAGCGIWATHFVAMLAYQPGMPMGYDAGVTVLSALIAIVLSAAGYWLALKRPLAGGAVAGAAIGAMHYVGMAAVHLPADRIWNFQYVAASAAIGVALMAVAMRIVIRSNSTRGSLAGAGLFTIAIVTMHFTGMTAVTFRPDPLIAVPNALVDPTTLAIAIAAVAFLIIALGLVGSLVDNHLERMATGEAQRLRGEIEERMAIARELLATNTTLAATQSAVRNLLDNSDQGFLTVAPDFLIGDQSSAACEKILGEAPGGKSITDLLCRYAPPDAKSTMCATLESVFRESQDFIRDLKIGLLPTTFELDGKTVQASYKFLADSGQLMLVLTDVTQTALLTATVERERQRLEMIVFAFTEGEAFTALVDDYRKFLTDELPQCLDRIATSSATGELYRRVHTYKGLLAQFSFHFSPCCLHALETRLSAETSWTSQSARETFRPEALLAELERDLQSVTEVLGPNTLPSGQRIALPQSQFEAMMKAARDALAGDAGRDVSLPLRKLLQTLADLAKLDVKAALALRSRGAAALATRLEKQLAPIRIEGDDVRVSPELYGEFFRSLVHVFRNAVDHGIETPEERVLAGKPAEGSVCCDVRSSSDALEIAIADDGCGVDRDRLEDKLVAAGLDPLQVEALSLEDLLCREGLSSRGTAGDVSGRGMGLSAVKSELDRLGGSVAIESTRGSGTRFRFRLPIKPDALAINVATLEAVNS